MGSIKKRHIFLFVLGPFAHNFSKTPNRRLLTLKGTVRVPGSAPTIPSKYLTIVTNNNEHKGFQGSSRRFKSNIVIYCSILKQIHLSLRQVKSCI
jgi:hypothetical protein